MGAWLLGSVCDESCHPSYMLEGKNTLLFFYIYFAADAYTWLDS